MIQVTKMEAAESNWERIPCRGMRVAIEHTPINALGECLRMMKVQRSAAGTAADHLKYNLSLVVLTCAFLESCLSRGLVHATNHALFMDPKSGPTDEKRRALEKVKATVTSGDIFGDPFPTKPTARSYGRSIELVLGVSTADRQLFPEAMAQCVHTLFQLRNMIIHGQTLVASGVFPKGPLDPISDYQVAEHAKHKDVESYLASTGLWDSQRVAGDLSFPFVSNAIVDHLLKGAVDFLRTLRDSIPDQIQQRAFSDGWPQYLFPILAGEAVPI